MRPIVKYKCTQSALYQIAANVVASLTRYLPAFTAFKPKYNALYLTNLKAQIHTAEILPNFQARSAQAEINHINLCQYLATSCAQFQALKRYITSAFPPNIHKPRIEEAGNKHYRTATNKNWTAAQALFNSATQFIALHNSTLMANGNMPPSFPITFQNSITLFNQTLIAFQQAEEKIKIDTAQKIKTNNKLYNTIIEICLDGQNIYLHQPEIKDQFTIATLHTLVSGIGTTGVKGYITNAATSQPIAQVSIITLPPTKKTVTNHEGYYQLTQIPTGSYSLQISAPGFIPLSIPSYQIDTGITHHLSLQLHPT